MARVSKRTSLKLPQFVQKIISKTTEVKNLITQIQTLNAQKAQLQANNQSTDQVQAQLTQKQNKLTAKIIRTASKVNAIAKALKITILNFSESGSGSGSSGTGQAVGINVLDSITSDADKIIWDYGHLNGSAVRFEPYGNYLLKTTLNRPIVSTEIQNIVNYGTQNYFIIYPNSGLSTQGGGFSSLNPVYVKPQQYEINSSSRLIIQRDYLGQPSIAIPNMIYAIETHNLEFPIASLQTMPTANGTITGFILHPKSNNGLSYQPDRTPIKILKGPYPYYYELYEDGKMFSVNANFSESELKFRSRQNIDFLATQQDTAFAVYATGVFNAFSEDANIISILTQNNTFKVNYQYATEEYALPSGVTKENVSKIVINRGIYPVDAYVYILDNSNNLHFNRYLDNSWSIIDTGVRDISYNNDLAFVGIKMDYTFKRYPNNPPFYQDNPNGIIITGNKYRLISPKYAVRHFE